MRRLLTVLLPMALAAAVFGGVYEHGLYEAVPLNGEWEMAYQPYAYEVVDYPAFKGVNIAGAIPG